jgi:hypothetical protein
VLTLGLDDCDGGEAGEEDVVCPAGLACLLGGPLGDSEVLPALGAHAGGKSERLRVGLPAGGAQLAVDEHARRLLVELDRVAGLLGAQQGGGDLRGRCGRRSGLHRGQLSLELGDLGERCAGASGLGGGRLGVGARLLGDQRLHDRDVLGGLPRALLGGHSARGGGLGLAPHLLERPGRRLERRLVLLALLLEARELVVEPRLRLLRLGRGDERPGIELLVVAERALEPQRELTRHAQLMQRSVVVPRVLVGRGVSCPAQLVEDRPLLRPDGVAVDEPLDALLLRLAGVDEAAELREGVHREQLGEEAQGDEGRHGVLGELRLGLRGEHHELRVVVREVREVRRRRLGGS